MRSGHSRPEAFGRPVAKVEAISVPCLCFCLCGRKKKTSVQKSVSGTGPGVKCGCKQNHFPRYEEKRVNKRAQAAEAKGKYFVPLC